MSTWPRVQLRRFFRVVNGGTPTSDPLNWDGPISWATPVDLGRHHGGTLVVTDRTLTEIGLRTGSAAVPRGSLIVSTRAPIGYVVETTGPIAFNQGCRGLTPQVPVHVRFYRYALESVVLDMQAAGQGSTFVELSSGTLARQLVPAPPLGAQRVIADHLDTETAGIDALITKKRRMIDLLHEREGAFIEGLLTGGVHEEVPLRRLLLYPPSYGAGEAGVAGQEEWPRYIRITDLTDDGRLRPDAVLRLPPLVAQPYILKDGDLLLARSGATVGKSFHYRASMGSAAFAGYLIRFRPNPQKVVPQVLAAWTRTRQYWSQVRLASLQATIDNVSADRFKEFRVPLPDHARQPKLLRMIATASERDRRLTASLASQIGLLQEHRQALITAAVTGELELPVEAA